MMTIWFIFYETDTCWGVCPTKYLNVLWSAKSEHPVKNDAMTPMTPMVYWWPVSRLEALVGVFLRSIAGHHGPVWLFVYYFIFSNDYYL